MLETIEIKRQMEQGWPSQYEVMTEKQMADISYGAIAAAGRRVEEFLVDKLGKREKSYSHRGSNI